MKNSPPLPITSVHDLSERVHLAVGAASMCWNPSPGAARFDSAHALAVARGLIDAVEPVVAAYQAMYAAIAAHAPNPPTIDGGSVPTALDDLLAEIVSRRSGTPPPSIGGSDWRLLDEILGVLSEQCGRPSPVTGVGQSEGAVDTIRRIIDERDKLAEERDKHLHCPAAERERNRIVRLLTKSANEHSGVWYQAVTDMLGDLVQLGVCTEEAARLPPKLTRDDFEARAAERERERVLGAVKRVLQRARPGVPDGYDDLSLLEAEVSALDAKLAEEVGAAPSKIHAFTDEELMARDATAAALERERIIRELREHAGEVIRDAPGIVACLEVAERVVEDLVALFVPRPVPTQKDPEPFTF